MQIESASRHPPDMSNGVAMTLSALSRPQSPSCSAHMLSQKSRLGAVTYSHVGHGLAADVLVLMKGARPVPVPSGYSLGGADP